MFSKCSVKESALQIYNTDLNFQCAAVLAIIQSKDGVCDRYRTQNLILFHSSNHLAVPYL